MRANSLCPLHCPLAGRPEAAGPAPLPSSNGQGSLMAGIKLSLGFMCLLPNKFILDQTDLPAYAQDKMFK